jgi:ribonuclease Y
MQWTYVGILLAAAAGTGIGWWINGRFGANSLEAARRRGESILHDARRDAEKGKQRALLEAREEIFAQRNKAEQDFRSRKGQLLKRERDLRAQQEKLRAQETETARQRDALKEAEANLAAREAEVAEVRQRAEQLVEEELASLERISAMTREEARRQILTNLKAETRYEAAALIKEIKDEAQRSAESEATKIIALAIERAASDMSAERTVSQLQIPNGKEMKGRIIGHEGKNIRAFEKATGIQLLLDETGENVTFSGYNPVRREVARRVLEALVKDGNVHPKRIEDLVRRHRRRLDDEMRRAGEQTVKELGLKGVHGELVKLVGRLKYRSSYGQNVLIHSKEVAVLTGIMAAELRLDEKLARRAGLLHDIGKAIDYEREGTHPEIGAEFATRYGEPEIVVNAIASHHEDCDAISPISVLVAAADALSGARPGARRKSVAEYIKRIEQLEGLANSMEGVDQSYAIQAGREIRVIAKSDIVDDARVDLLASDLAARIQTEMDYPGKIKVTVIREVRAVEYAR